MRLELQTMHKDNTVLSDASLKLKVGNALATVHPAWGVVDSGVVCQAKAQRCLVPAAQGMI